VTLGVLHGGSGKVREPRQWRALEFRRGVLREMRIFPRRLFAVAVAARVRGVFQQGK
jgi:hypothetical protein